MNIPCRETVVVVLSEQGRTRPNMANLLFEACKNDKKRWSALAGLGQQKNRNLVQRAKYSFPNTLEGRHFFLSNREGFRQNSSVKKKPSHWSRFTTNDSTPIFARVPCPTRPHAPHNPSRMSFTCPDEIRAHSAPADPAKSSTASK